MALATPITSYGGGYGGSPGGGAAAGGSGGGATPFNQPDDNFGAGNTPPSDPPQGKQGGTGLQGSSGLTGGGASGGGGGATQNGQNATNISPAYPGVNGKGGAGGAGAPNAILGPTTTYAGGGAGSNYLTGEGGVGGAGGGGNGGVYNPVPCRNGAPVTSTNGAANTGGGAGGGHALAGRTGGSGIVVVRGPSTLTFTGGPCAATTFSAHPGGDKIAKFTASGTLTIAR